MQTQKRTPSHAAPVSKHVPAVPAKQALARSTPVELDAQALRHVAGGTTDGPKKYW